MALTNGARKRKVSGHASVPADDFSNLQLEGVLSDNEADSEDLPSEAELSAEEADEFASSDEQDAEDDEEELDSDEIPSSEDEEDVRQQIRDIKTGSGTKDKVDRTRSLADLMNGGSKADTGLVTQPGDGIIETVDANGNPRYIYREIDPVYDSDDSDALQPMNTIGNIPLSYYDCLLYTSPSPRDGLLSRMPSSA